MIDGGKRAGSTIMTSQVGLLAVLLLWFLIRGISPRYDILLATLLLIPIWHISRRTVLRDLIPFIMIFITYESLRGFGGDVRFTDIHIEDLIAYERSLFGGTIPAYYLQSTLMQGPFGPLLDYLTTALYASHFFVPVVTAILLWYRARPYYWSFVIGFILVAYVGFATYLFYPAAPPWWATKYGYLVDQPVKLPAHFVTMASLTSKIGPNKVAAMPSLHMGFPTYVTLFCVYVWGKKTAWLFILPFSVGFSTIYLGHHYTIDLMAGGLLALSVFAGVATVRGNLNRAHERVEQRVRRRLARTSPLATHQQSQHSLTSHERSGIS